MDYKDYATQKAIENNLDPEFVHTIFGQESNWNAKAQSPKNARGIAQLMPATAQRMGVKDINDPYQNMEGGIKYLAYLDKMFDGNKELVAAAYNAGEGAVKKYGGIPPYKETQDYVAKLNRNYLNPDKDPMLNPLGASTTATPAQPQDELDPDNDPMLQPMEASQTSTDELDPDKDPMLQPMDQPVASEEPKGPAPNLILSGAQGAVGGAGEMAKTVMHGVAGLVNKGSEWMGGDPGIADPLFKAGDETAKYMNNLILSEKEQANGTLANKVVAGVGGMAPYLLTGPAAVPMMAASGTMSTGENMINKGATLGQAQAGGVLGGAVGGAMGIAPAVASTIPRSAALSAGLNFVSGAGQDYVIHNVILRPDQKALKAEYDPWDLDKRVTELATGAFVGAGLKGMQNRANKVADKNAEKSSQELIDKLGITVDKTMPSDLPKPVIPQGMTAEQYAWQRYTDNDATIHEILGIIDQSEHKAPWMDNLIKAYASFSRDIGLDLAQIRKAPPAGGSSWYDPITGGIKMQRTLEGNPQDHLRILLHEVTHSLTNGAIEWRDHIKANNITDLSNTQKKMVEKVDRMETLYHRAADAFAKSGEAANWQDLTWKDSQGQQKTGFKDGAELRAMTDYIAKLGQNKSQREWDWQNKYYGFKDLHEFASETLTSEAFQKMLSEHRLRSDEVGSLKVKEVRDNPSLWEAYKASIKKIMVDGGGSYNHTILDLAIDNITHTASSLGEAQRLPTHLWNSQGGQNVKHLIIGGRTTPGDIAYAVDKSAERRQMALDKYLMSEEGKKLTGVDASILKQLAYYRKWSPSKEMFAERAALIVPNAKWGEFLSKNLDRFWENGRHLQELADRAVEIHGTRKLWSKSEPDVHKFMEGLAKDYLGPDGEVVKQLPVHQDLDKTGTYTMNAQTLRLMKGKTFAGAVLKYVMDRAQERTQIKAIQYERAKAFYGKFNDLNNKSRFKILDAIESYQSPLARKRLEDLGLHWPTEAELRQQHGLNDKEIAAFHDLAKGTEYLWSLIQQARTTMGMPELKFMPAYMPHIYTGAYKVFVTTRGNEAQVVRVKGFNNRYAAEAYAKRIKEEGTFNIQQDAETLKDFSVAKFKDLSGSVGDNLQDHMKAYENALMLDPRTLETLQQIDLNSMRGFSKHMLEREDVAGWIGQGGSGYGQKWQNRVSANQWLTKDQRQMLLLYQNYAKNVTNFHSNVLFMDEVVSPLTDVAPNRSSGRVFYGSMFSETSNLKNAIKDFAANFTGENFNKLKGVDDFFQENSIKIGIDPLLYKKVVREMKNLLSNVKLKVNPSNYIANVLQPANSLSILQLFNGHMLAEAKANGEKISLPNVFASFARGMKAMTAPSKDQEAALQWAKDQHITDPTIRAELKTSTFGAGIDKGHSPLNPFHWNEGIESFGRKLSFLVAYEHMKKVYKGDEQAAREAAQGAMEMTMVNYDRSERPLMYQNLGVAGEFISPFAVFRNAYIGNTILTLKHMKENAGSLHGYAPFLLMQGTYLTLAGAMGMVGINEWEAMANFINKNFPEMHIPTPKKFFLEHGMPNWAFYGQVSNAAGVNLSASMNSVSLTDTGNLALAEFMKGIAQLGYIGVRQLAQGISSGELTGPPVSAMRGPLNAVMPKIVKPILDEYLYGDLRRRMATKPDTQAYMTPEQKKLRMLTGSDDLKVARELDSISVDIEDQKYKQRVSKEMVQIAVDAMDGNATKREATQALHRWMEITDGTYDAFFESVRKTREGQKTSYTESLSKEGKLNSMRRLKEIMERMK